MNERSEPRLRFSIVIPSWHEAENLATLLPVLRQIDNIAEAIVVDASGDSQAERIAQECNAIFLGSDSPNRGEQMNRGAESASGDVLVFQHADTELTAAHVFAMEAALRDPAIIGGAFHRKFDSRHPHLRFLDRLARFRTQHGGIFFGDQSIFVRREVFKRLGGFAAIPLMEDVEFSRQLRVAGRIAIIDPPVQSSARRHLQRGVWRTTLQNGLILLLYDIGVSPARLHRWYYDNRQSRQSPGDFGTELKPVE